MDWTNRAQLIGACSGRNARVIPNTSPAPWHQITFLAALLIHVALGTFPGLDRSCGGETKERREEKEKWSNFMLEIKKKKTQKGGRGGGGGLVGCDPFTNVPAAAL